MVFRVISLTGGNDTLAVGPATSGVIHALGGDDRLTLHGRSAATLQLVMDQPGGMPTLPRWEPLPGHTLSAGLTQVWGGAGADVLTLTGRGIEATVADDATGDRINARWLTQGVLLVGRQDLVVGPNDATAQVVVLGVGPTDGFEFQGGIANDVVRVEHRTQVFGWNGDDVLAVGDRSLVNGGNGDDRLFAGATSRAVGGAGNDRITGTGVGVTALGGAGDDTIGSTLRIVAAEGAGRDTLHSAAAGSVLDGGDGDDLLRGTYLRENALSGADRFELHYSGHRTVLKGGAGNDTIRMDADDSAWGGTGADRFIAFERAGDAATIGDFAAGADTLLLKLPEDEAAADFSDLTVEERNGHTILRLDGQVVMRLLGATDLAVRLQHEDGDTVRYTDLDGTPVTGGQWDVTIDVFETI